MLIVGGLVCMSVLLLQLLVARLFPGCFFCLLPRCRLVAPCVQASDEPLARPSTEDVHAWGLPGGRAVQLGILIRWVKKRLATHEREKARFVGDMVGHLLSSPPVHLPGICCCGPWR